MRKVLMYLGYMQGPADVLLQIFHVLPDFGVRCF